LNFAHFRELSWFIRRCQLGNTNWGGRLSTLDLLIRVACFVKNLNNIFNIKGGNQNWLVQGGQPYRAFPFCKTSLVLKWKLSKDKSESAQEQFSEDFDEKHESQSGNRSSYNDSLVSGEKIKKWSDQNFVKKNVFVEKKCSVVVRSMFPKKLMSYFFLKMILSFCREYFLIHFVAKLKLGCINMYDLSSINLQRGV
jgi:hypothetical protein